MRWSKVLFFVAALACDDVLGLNPTVVDGPAVAECGQTITTLATKQNKVVAMAADDQGLFWLTASANAPGAGGSGALMTLEQGNPVQLTQFNAGPGWLALTATDVYWSAETASSARSRARAAA